MVIQVKRSLEGLTRNQSMSMTMREGKIREIYELSLQKMMPKMIESIKEFTTSKSEIDSVEYPLISQVMLEVAQDCVEAMDKDVAGLRERFARTLQEAKKKLQKEKPDVSGSRTSHK